MEVVVLGIGEDLKTVQSDVTDGASCSIVITHSVRLSTAVKGRIQLF